MLKAVTGHGRGAARRYGGRLVGALVLGGLLVAGLLVGGEAQAPVAPPTPDREAVSGTGQASLPRVIAPVPSAPAEPPAPPPSRPTPPPQQSAAPVSVPPPAAPAAKQPPHTHIAGIRHEYQRLNNCGPVTIGMALSRWGSPLTQYDIAPVLKPNRNDKNVSSEELADFARARGYGAVLAEHGTLDLLRQLLAGGFPVIVETWYVTPSDGGMGHFQLLTGYNDAGARFGALDSYEGRLSLPYPEFDRLWRGYARRYLVVFPPEREAQVHAILGERADPARARALELKAAGADAAEQPDSFGFLNLGLARLRVGDSRGAAQAFDQARLAPRVPALDPTRPPGRSGNWPWRTLWYRFEPLEAYLRVDRSGEVERLATEVLRDTPGHEEVLYWRGRARAAQGNVAGARADYLAALNARPSYREARLALEGL